MVPQKQAALQHENLLLYGACVLRFLQKNRAVSEKN